MCHAWSFLQTNLAKLTPSLPCEVAVIKTAFDSTLQAVEVLVEKERQRFGSIANSSCANVIAKLRTEFTATLHLNLEASEAACQGELDRIQSSVGNGIVSLVTWERTKEGAYDAIRQRIESINTGCKVRCSVLWLQFCPCDEGLSMWRTVVLHRAPLVSSLTPSWRLCLHRCARMLTGSSCAERTTACGICWVRLPSGLHMAYLSAPLPMQFLRDSCASLQPTRQL